MVECINLGITTSHRSDNDDDLSTTITCAASGNPRPSIQWTKCHSGHCSPYPFQGQHEDIFNQSTAISTLKINRTNPSEIGKISCQSVNKCETVPGDMIWNVKQLSPVTLGKILFFSTVNPDRV